MATQILFSWLFLIVEILLISCFTPLFSSYVLSNEKTVQLLSNRQRDNFLHDLSFPRSLPIKAIYQFGDSYSDTGNLIRADPSTNCGKLPYGLTLSNKPNGRCSDGLLSIDYFAKFLNLPLIDPYLKKEGNFTNGVNFGVIGARALKVTTSIMEDTFNISPNNNSLATQLDWFKSHLRSFYSNSSERKSKLAEGLFFMGEIGINDYIFPLSTGKTLPDFYKKVPDVIQAIRNATEEIINDGATQIVIPGTIPFGCMPPYLTKFHTNESNKYDEFNCLKDYNKLSKFHNSNLKKTITKLRKAHPNLRIVYMDNFGAFKAILKHPTLFGFDKTVTQKACCGKGNNAYNFNASEPCGKEGVPCCKNPQEYVTWDGIHLTQQTNHVLAKLLIRPVLRALHIVKSRLLRYNESCDVV